MLSKQSSNRSRRGLMFFRVAMGTLVLISLWHGVASWNAIPPSASTQAATTAVNHADLSLHVRAELRTVPIQDIVPGMRVLARNPELRGQQIGQSTFDAHSWRLIVLEMTKPDGSRLEIQLLRPRAWLWAHAVKQSVLDPQSSADASFARPIEELMTQQQISLDLAEMGATGPATITRIGPCPDIEPSDHPDRHVVTGTFKHTAGEVLDLQIAGADESIGVTPNHLFWSVDRADFVPAEQLVVGERLQQADGTVTRLVRSTPRRGPPVVVYNLEVDAQHTYFVGPFGLLVHNKYEGDWIVYQLVDEAETAVYFGRSTNPGRRIGEHVADGKIFDHMDALTDPVDEKVAAKLEGQLIRERLEAMGRGDADGRVRQALEDAGLQNRNRGLVPRKWIPDYVWDLTKDPERLTE